MAHKRNTRDEAPQDSGTEAEEVLAKRFGGLHTGAWVDKLPSSWIPYVQLARLSPPVPVLLIYFPHLFGIALNAVARQPPLSEVLRISLLLLGGSFFLSNAIHGWNDLIDAPIDKLIPRTRNRPIPRGAISPAAALYFTISQALGAALFLFLLPYDTALCTIPSVVSHTYYPFAKRHTYFPQVVLAVSLQWAIMVGNSAMGGQWTDKPALYLFSGAMLWTVIYDTIYAYQDYEHDIKLGVKSTAVLFGEWGKPILWLLSNCMVALISVSGRLAGMGYWYYVFGVAGTFGSLNFMMANVDLKSAESCHWWFVYGFWGPALSLPLGLFLEYFSK